jgi:hypothetical protein
MLAHRASIAPILCAAACVCPAGGTSLVPAPPRAGIRPVEAVSLECVDGETFLTRFGPGAAVRQRLSRHRPAPGHTWTATYGPEGLRWRVLSPRGSLAQDARIEDVGPFVGGLPAALAVVAPDGLLFDGGPVPQDQGATGLLYLVGAGRSFELRGGLPDRPGQSVRIVLYAHRGEDGSPLAALGGAGLALAYRPEDDVEEPVPEPATIVVFGAAVAAAAGRRISARRAR